MMDNHGDAWMVEIPGAGLPYPVVVMLGGTQVSGFRDMVAEISGVSRTELTLETYATGGTHWPDNPIGG